MALVTLLTDFGTVDGFVGAMKGVLLAVAPEATLVDITHDIPPQDVFAGAWSLREAARCFAPGTIHVAVVDPGVGTARAPLILRAGGQLFVGPDNGLLALAADALGSAEGWIIDRPELLADRVSATFHGRDVFAPVAGQLAAGCPPEACGRSSACWRRLTLPAVVEQGGALSGEVLQVDRFGNLITNIPRAELASRAGLHEGTGGGVLQWVVSLAGRRIGPVRETFGSVADAQWVAYVGSSELLEIAIRGGSAARAAGVGRGATVRVEPAQGER